MMTAFSIFGIFSIVCLTVVAGGNQRSSRSVVHSSGFQCPSEGFHPDPYDCRIFYRCVYWSSKFFFLNFRPKLTPFQFTCGEGTVFDPVYNTCSHPEQTLRKECGGRGSGGDASNDQYPFTYPPSIAPVGEYPVYPMEEVNPNYPESYPNEYENQISPGGEMMELSPAECSGEGFFPVPGDCTRFLRCTDDGMGSFKKFVFRCGDGTVWDQQNLVCNHPGSVLGCGGSESGQNLEEGGDPEDGNPLEFPQGGEPGNRPEQSGLPQGNYPNQGGYPDQIVYPDTDKRPPPENQGNPGQGSKPDQSQYFPQEYPGEEGYPTSGNNSTGQNLWYPQQQSSGPPENQQENRPGSQGGYPNHGGYPSPGNKPPEQNQGSKPPKDQESRPDQFGYPPQGGYPNQQNQGGYPTFGNQPQNQGYPEHGSKPLVNQQNQDNRPNPPQLVYPGDQNQGNYPTSEYLPPEQNQVFPQQQQGDRPPTTQQNRPDQSGYPQQGGYPGNQQYGPNQFEYPQQSEYPNGPGEAYPQQGQPNEGNPPGDNNQMPIRSPNACKADGFFSVIGDCMKFYRCVNNGKGGYIRYDFSCGPGTIWDQELTTCNYPWAVQRTDCSVPDGSDMNSGSFPDMQQSGFGQSPSQGTLTTPAQQQPSNQNQMTTQTNPNQQPPSNQNQMTTQTNPTQQPPSNQNQMTTQTNPNQQPPSNQNQMTTQTNPTQQPPSNQNQMTTQTNPNQQPPSNQNQMTTQTNPNQQPPSNQNQMTTQTNPNQQPPSNQNQMSTQTNPTQQPTPNQNQMTIQPTSTQQTPSNQNQMTTRPIPTQQTTSNPNQMLTQITPRPEGHTTQTATTEGSQEGNNTPQTPPGGRPSQPDKEQPVKCEKAGFYSVPGNCKKFYRCVDWDGDKGQRFSVFFFECGDSTIWDPALEACNYEESVYPPRDCSMGQNNQTTSAPIMSTMSQATTQSPEPTRPDGANTTPQDESTSSRPAESTENTTTGEITTERQETTSEQTEQPTEPDSNTPAESSSPTEPVSTNPTEPGSSSPTEPGSTNPTEPGSSSPTEPGSTTPTEPGISSPTQPGSSSPAEPGSSTSTEPDSSIPTEPGSTNPSEPGSSSPTEPGSSTSTEPDSSIPTEPGSTNPSELGSSSPTEPGSSNPTEPGSSSPTELGTNNPTEPGDTNPTEPTPDEDNNNVNRPGESTQDCPAVEEGQVLFVCPTGFRRHPKDCNLFYQCTTSKEGDVNIMTFTCMNDSVYDERKIQCLPPEETKPCRNKSKGGRRYTRRVEPELTSVVPISSTESLCPREGHFPYDGNCHMFFKCQKDDNGRMQGYLYQCQPKHTFSPESGRCERSSGREKCFRFGQYLTSTNLKWMTSKVPIEYFDVR